MMGQRGWEAAMPRQCQLAQGRQRCQAAVRCPGCFLGDCVAMGELLPCVSPAPRLRLPQHNAHGSGTSALLIRTVARGHTAPTGPSLVWTHQGALPVPATLASPPITGCAPPHTLEGCPGCRRGKGPLSHSGRLEKPSCTWGEQSGPIQPQSRGPGEVLGKAFSPAASMFPVPSACGRAC